MADLLAPIFDKVVPAGPEFMKGFMRGFTLSDRYDPVFERLIDEEADRG